MRVDTALSGYLIIYTSWRDILLRTRRHSYPFIRSGSISRQVYGFHCGLYLYPAIDCQRCIVSPGSPAPRNADLLVIIVTSKIPPKIVLHALSVLPLKALPFHYEFLPHLLTLLHAQRPTIY